MGAKTNINWCDSTWNALAAEKGPWHCTKVSPACENCYAERFTIQKGGKPFVHGADTIRLKTHAEKSFLDPLRWRRPRKVFTCSMTDLFHEQVKDEWIDAIYGIMAACQFKSDAKGNVFPGHIFQTLTKRVERQREYLSGDHRKAWAKAAVFYAGGRDPDLLYDTIASGPQVLPHVWVGTTVEDQKRADERLLTLMRTRAAIRWASFEPLLGLVRLTRNHVYCPTHDFAGGFCSGYCPDQIGLDWAVVGGESGPRAVRRDMDPAWAESLMEQCEAAGTAFWMKQMGGFRPGGPIPDHLHVRQFPEQVTA